MLFCLTRHALQVFFASTNRRPIVSMRSQEMLQQYNFPVLQSRVLHSQLAQIFLFSIFPIPPFLFPHHDGRLKNFSSPSAFSRRAVTAQFQVPQA